MGWLSVAPLQSHISCLRFVAGLREVLKAITVGKAKYVVVAPNIEPNPTPGKLSLCHTGF